MKILIINPNTCEEMTRAIGEAADKYARPQTAIEAVNPDFGPRSIERSCEEHVAAHAMLEKILAARSEYDAIIIACGGDPGLYAARELVDVPVIGIAEASFHFATVLGYKFSVVVPQAGAKASVERLARLHGFAQKLASVRAVNLSVLELSRSSKAVEERLIDAARNAVEEDGAEVICLGCAGMALMDKTIEAAIGVPVLDGIVCAVKIAEGMYDYGLKTSKVGAFKTPRPKEYVACSDLFKSI